MASVLNVADSVLVRDSGPVSGRLACILCRRLVENRHLLFQTVAIDHLDLLRNVMIVHAGHGHRIEPNRLDEILTQPLTMSRAERTTWTTLWAELRGDRIRIGIGDIESAESKAVTKDLDGCIGVFVSGDSSFKAPVQFRNLRVDGL